MTPNTPGPSGRRKSYLYERLHMENMEIVKDDESVEPLDKSEEFKLKKNLEARFLTEIGDLYDRVIAIKGAIETPEFVEIFIKPIRGNIDKIKQELEDVDKPRELAMKQGALRAYRKMLHFPTTAVDALAAKVKEVKKELPLFINDESLVKDADRIYFDPDKYRIITE